MTLVQSVLDACRSRGWHIATAESCTGGLVAAALTAIAGSSEVVERGFVTYSNEAKIEMLAVPSDTIAAHGAVSAQTAAAMARGAVRRAAADVAVSITGIVGPGGGTSQKPVGLFRGTRNRAAGLADRCCHRAAPLHMGSIVEAGLQCGYHGLIFDGSGRCVAIPGQSRIPDDARVRSYPVVEKDQLVWVWMGEATKADPASIVDFPFHNDKAKWPNKHDVYPIKGNYMLMVDNLMDLTHLGYLHAKTGGGNPAAHVGAEMKTTRTPRGLKFTRWMKNSVPPPSYVKAAGFTGRVDRCQEFEFIAPSTVLQWTGATDAGSDYADPQRDFRFQFRLFHGLTPETETSCFYFRSE